MASNQRLPDWSAVDQYVKARAESSADTYGWLRLEDRQDPTALILVKLCSDPSSFPASIGGVRMEIRPVEEPERQVE